jgi:hypothetical protein
MKLCPPLTGQRFGRLLVLSEVPASMRPHIRKRAWFCACDCGGFKIVPSERLKGGHPPTRSCGCLFAERMVSVRNPRRQWAAAQARAAQPLTVHPLKGYAVDHTYEWNYDLSDVPKATKIQILTAGGVAIYGHWTKTTHFIAWAPLPRRNYDKEHEHAKKRTA